MLRRDEFPLTGLYAFVQNAATLHLDLLGTDPVLKGGEHPAKVNAELHVANITKILPQMEEHLSRNIPAFGCAKRLAKQALYEAKLYAEHEKGDDTWKRKTEKTLEDIQAWDKAYNAAKRTEIVCKRITLVSGVVLMVCAPQCLSLRCSSTFLRLCPAFCP